MKINGLGKFAKFVEFIRNSITNEEMMRIYLDSRRSKEALWSSSKFKPSLVYTTDKCQIQTEINITRSTRTIQFIFDKTNHISRVS